MISLDTINAGMMTGGLFMNVLNCRRIYLDKEVVGVSLIPTIYYIFWAIFGAYYFYTLNQPYSALLDVIMIIGYIVWLSMAINYRYKET